MVPEPPPPDPELSQLEPVTSLRKRGTPLVRVLMWVLMSMFLTVPLVGMGVFTYISLKRWDRSLKKAPPVVVAPKKQEPEIPDNIDWENPDWSEIGTWAGTGGGKFGPITIGRSRVRFVMEVSPSRGAKRAETANFRLINVEDTGIQNLIGGMRAPGRYDSDSYQYRRKKGWPLGDYTLQVEVQGTPAWRVVGFEDMQFPEPKAAAADKKK